MAESFNVPGACLVKIDYGSGLSNLGYAMNAVEIVENPLYLDIPVDYNGGDDGIPGDVQYMGEFHRVRMELSKWDLTTAAAALAKLKGGTAGTIGTIGTLMAGGSKVYRLTLVSTSLGRNYLAAFLRDQQETQRGTKFARLLLDWICYPDSSGVIYNATLS